MTTRITHRMRRGLALLAVAGLSACMLPRSVYFRDAEDHLAHHEQLSAAYGAPCLPEHQPADASSSAERPSERPADHRFAGDFYGQLEHVWLEGETYSYAERWDLGVVSDWSVANVGWDWKVGCTMHTCQLTAGDVCCYQACADGGAAGMGYEAPDRFGCMNAAAGGQFQWFLDGLREAGVPGVEACSQASRL